jgi:hypothetical protein
MFSDPKPEAVPNWSCILQRSDAISIELAKSYLNDHQIPSQILSKRDSAYSLNVGLMAQVYLYVPEEFADKARQLVHEYLDQQEGSDNE